MGFTHTHSLWFWFVCTAFLWDREGVTQWEVVDQQFYGFLRFYAARCLPAALPFIAGFTEGPLTQIVQVRAGIPWGPWSMVLVF